MSATPKAITKMGIKQPIKKHFSMLGKISLCVIIALILCSVFAPLIVSFNPNEIDLSHKFAPIDSTHWLGSDHLGRDIFARIVYGARISISAAFLTLAMILGLGLVIGGLSGFIGGKVDRIIMRVCDLFLCVPTIILSLFLVGVLGGGLQNVIIAIALTHWAWYARIIRSIVLSLRNKEFVQLSFVYGSSPMENFRRNMLMPILSQCIVLVSMDIGHIILHIAGLSFLGLGVQAPQAEWGVMLSEAKDFMWSNPLLMIYPGVALFVSIALFNMLGESLRDYFDIDLGEIKC